MPNSSINEINLYEKENEDLYGEAITITDEYKSIFEKLSPEERKELEYCLTTSQRDEKTIRLLLLAYERSGNSLI